MLLRSKFGYIEVVIGDSFQFGLGRWRVESFDIHYTFKTEQAPAGTMPVLCSLVEGEPRYDVAKMMMENEFGVCAFFSGCSVAALCAVDWIRVSAE